MTLVVSDADPATPNVTVTATVNPDGSYSATADLSGLTDGPLSVTASVMDAAGNPATANGTASLDTSAGITVSLADVNAANVAAAPISGMTTGIEPGRTVTLVVSDGDSATPNVTVTAVINPDGSYSTTADLSSLSDGPLSVTASVTDSAGNVATANDTAEPRYGCGYHGEPGRCERRQRRGRADQGHDDRHRSRPDGHAGGERCRPGDAEPDRYGHHQPRRQLQHDGRLVRLEDGPLSVIATVADAAGNVATANATAALDTSAGITVSLADVNAANATAAPISGTTTGIEPGRMVTLVVSDGDSATPDVTFTAVINPDGSYSTMADLSGLTDGPLSVTATVTDAAGNVATANDTASLDTSAGISVSLADVNAANAAAVPISGTTTGIEPGRTVTLVVSDADPATPNVSVTAVINPDGSYSTTADLSNLSDGPLSVTASVTDAAGNPATANDTASLDTSAGITVSLADVNAANVAATPISGMTTGIEPGRMVTLVVSDGDPATPNVTVTAVINPDGSYSTTADLSSLSDGPLSVTASVTDSAGNVATANDTAALDTSAGVTVSLADVNAANAAAAPIAGTTTGIEPGRTVTLVVSDADPARRM